MLFVWSAVTWSALVATSASRSTPPSGSALQERIFSSSKASVRLRVASARSAKDLVTVLKRRQQIDQKHLPAQPPEHLAVEPAHELLIGGVARDERRAIGAGPLPHPLAAWAVLEREEERALSGSTPSSARKRPGCTKQRCRSDRQRER